MCEREREERGRESGEETNSLQKAVFIEEIMILKICFKIIYRKKEKKIRHDYMFHNCLK